MAAKNFSLLAGVVALAVSGSAFALKSDKNQATNIDAAYQKTVQSKTGAANDPNVTDLDGNVLITKGSIKMNSGHATIHQTPAGAGANGGKIARVILTGKQAHMQQLHDGDCSLMTANADKIDYNPLTNLADLTGNVVVTQAGRGEFHGEHMLYNTDTGDMESGQVGAAQGRIHMVMEAQTEQPAASTNNCGYPGGTAPAAKATDKPATKPADKKADKH
ncbi:MAG: lipopolysaccharide transport periplasmic protein LptA [Gammaproteobacteria bacterium]|nr:MAG: lipopolysaccharide transport periplasmic protein LptA [Gammaproteobacteria bacterium]